MLIETDGVLFDGIGGVVLLDECRHRHPMLFRRNTIVLSTEVSVVPTSFVEKLLGLRM